MAEFTTRLAQPLAKDIILQPENALRVGHDGFELRSQAEGFL